MDHTIHDDLTDLLHEGSTLCPPSTRIDIDPGDGNRGNSRRSSTPSSLSSSSPPSRIIVTFYIHPHLYIPYPVQYEFRIPLSYPTVPPLVRCITTEFIRHYHNQAQLDKSTGLSLLSLLNGSSSPAVMLGGWSRTYTLADILHCLRRTLLRTGPIVTKVQHNGKPLVYDIFTDPTSSNDSTSNTTSSNDTPSSGRYTENNVTVPPTGRHYPSSSSSSSLSSSSSIPSTFPRATSPVPATQPHRPSLPSSSAAPFPTPRGASIPKSSLPLLESGHYGLVGRRPTMEDTVIHFDDIPIRIVPSDDKVPTVPSTEPTNKVPYSLHIGLYGVFDGHGGTRASEYAANRLPSTITSYLSKNYTISEALHVAFQQVDKDFEKEVSQPQHGTGLTRITNSRGSSRGSTRSTGSAFDNPFSSSSSSSSSLSFDIGGLQIGDEQSGCTAVVVVLAGEPGNGGTITVANAGDSRAVLCRNGQAVPLSNDHKTERQDERARILSAGGLVIRGRVLGKLAVTRAIGDIPLKRGAEDRPLVTAEPELMEAALLDEDEFLLLGCDGLFDVIDSQQACDIVREGFRKGLSPEQTAKVLTQSAYEAGSADNISALVVKIRKNTGGNGNGGEGSTTSRSTKNEAERSLSGSRSAIGNNNGSSSTNVPSSFVASRSTGGQSTSTTSVDELARGMGTLDMNSHKDKKKKNNYDNDSKATVSSSYSTAMNSNIPRVTTSYDTTHYDSTNTVTPSSSTFSSLFHENAGNPYGRRRAGSGSVGSLPSSTSSGSASRTPKATIAHEDTSMSNNKRISTTTSTNLLPTSTSTVSSSSSSTLWNSAPVSLPSSYTDNNSASTGTGNSHRSSQPPNNNRGRSVSPMIPHTSTTVPISTGAVKNTNNTRPTNNSTTIPDTEDSVAALIAGLQYHHSSGTTSNYGYHPHHQQQQSQPQPPSYSRRTVATTSNPSSVRNPTTSSVPVDIPLYPSSQTLHPNNGDEPSSQPLARRRVPVTTNTGVPSSIPRSVNEHNVHSSNHNHSKNSSSTGLLSALHWHNDPSSSSSSSSSNNNPNPSYTTMIPPSVSSSSVSSLPTDVPIGGRRFQRSMPSTENPMTYGNGIPPPYRSSNPTNSTPSLIGPLPTTNNRAPSPMVLPYGRNTDNNNNNYNSNSSSNSHPTFTSLPSRGSSTTSNTGSNASSTVPHRNASNHHRDGNKYNPLY